MEDKCCLNQIGLIYSIYALIIIIPLFLSFLSASIQNTGILCFFSLLSEEVSSKKSTYGMLIFHAWFEGIRCVHVASTGESSSITAIFYFQV